MNIIIIPKGGSARTLRLSSTAFGSAAVVGFLMLGVFCVGAISLYQKLVYGKSLSYSADASRLAVYAADNFADISERLGKMQAQLLKLNILGQELGQMMGVKSSDVVPETGKQSQGGPLLHVSTAEVAKDPQAYLDALAKNLEMQSDYLTMLRHWQLENQAHKNVKPSLLPILDAPMTSGYGYRLDPFTKEMAMHQGIDLAAPIGTPVHSSAAGMVITAEHHPEYGNMVEVSHENGLVTRYAHMSAIKVKVGRYVKPGDVLGLVGQTGRANGPHLHFEVRIDGVARNPVAYLR